MSHVQYIKGIELKSPISCCSFELVPTTCNCALPPFLSRIGNGTSVWVQLFSILLLTFSLATCHILSIVEKAILAILLMIPLYNPCSEREIRSTCERLFALEVRDLVCDTRKWAEAACKLQYELQSPSRECKYIWSCAYIYIYHSCTHHPWSLPRHY